MCCRCVPCDLNGQKALWGAPTSTTLDLFVCLYRPPPILLYINCNKSPVWKWPYFKRFPGTPSVVAFFLQKLPNFGVENCEKLTNFLCHSLLFLKLVEIPHFNVFQVKVHTKILVGLTLSLTNYNLSYALYIWPVIKLGWDLDWVRSKIQKLTPRLPY